MEKVDITRSSQSISLWQPVKAIDIKHTSGKGLFRARNKLEKYYMKGSNVFIYLCTKERERWDVHTEFWWGSLREKSTWKPMRILEDNIKTNLQESGWRFGLHCLAQDRPKRQALVKSGKKFRVQKLKRISWLFQKQLPFQEEICSMDLVNPLKKSRVSAVGIETTPRTWWGSNPVSVKKKIFLLSKTSGLALGPYTASSSICIEALSLCSRARAGAWCWPLLHLASRLRMSGVTPPLTISHHDVEKDRFTLPCSCTIHDLKIKNSNNIRDLPFTLKFI